MRHRWAGLIAVAVLAIALASAGLACASPEHHAAGVVAKRTSVPPPAPTAVASRTSIPPPAPTGIVSRLVSITGLEPSSGPPGTVVTLSGRNFTGPLTVCFGRWQAAGVKASDGGTRLTVVTPGGTGSVDVVVGNASGVSKGRPFTFTGAGILGGSATSHCLTPSASAEPS